MTVTTTIQTTDQTVDYHEALTPYWSSKALGEIETTSLPTTNHEKHIILVAGISNSPAKSDEGLATRSAGLCEGIKHSVLDMLGSSLLYLWLGPTPAVQTSVNAGL
jgi:formyltetrahydrofolate synthetase